MSRPARSLEGPATEHVKIRLTAGEVDTFGARALQAGYVRTDGKPAIGAWLRSLGAAA